MRRKITLLVACLLVAWLLQAPSAPGQSENTAGIWLDVPYVKQSEDGCGSASLAMLLQYWNAHGAPIDARLMDAAAIQQELYSPRAHGILASDMERYLKLSGFRVFSLRGSWQDLQDHLRSGRPLIIALQPPGIRTRFHYVVAVGMNWQPEAVFVNDPARGKLLRVEREEFEKEWRATGNWMLLAIRKSAG